ncbi:sigma-70 family RNA polymerase sigma factor [Flagellimonas aequoris]|uniref:Sigma-70 family RNA polymerase sigma factor n=1 Tax=Flagellimonas aequoris TaxID=2306997 RepID=A0A418N802_9FLAO|nr:sigma-70 family RNA polymerase sigma factor [Allomuricauda aequoris]RIV71172.1 sigma-70 family RNA polymerase sigma factor [Allomuricauda aequoris]TXK02546.1 sigma-70 family RNA polymerase sigma factor [Allomuricauda aequoris]
MTSRVEKLFKDNYTFLCLVSFAIVKDRDVAKDIVQDFFVSFWNKRESISITTSFASYARKSVKNLSLLYLEKEKKEKRVRNDLDSDNFSTQPASEKSSKNNKLYDLLNQMPDKRKEIFISFVVDGKSYSEIAESKGVSKNTVKTQMKRAYAFLRSHKKEDFI